MLATTAPRQGHFLSLRPNPWQTYPSPATTSSTHDLHTLQIGHTHARERSWQHTTVTPPAPSRSMPASTSLFSSQVDPTSPTGCLASISSHDGSIPQLEAATHDSTDIATRERTFTNTYTADSVQSASSDPALLAAPLHREEIARSLRQKMATACPTSIREQSDLDVASPPTRRGSALAETAPRKAYTTDKRIFVKRRRFGVPDDLDDLDSSEGEVDESDGEANSDEGFDEEDGYDGYYPRSHSHEDADVEYDGDEEHTQEEHAELVRSPLSVLPIPIPAPASVDDPHSIPVPLTPHFVSASPKALPPLPVPPFPLKDRTEARPLRPSLTRRDPRRTKALPKQTATLPTRRRERRYSISDPGHTLVSASAPNPTSLAALAHLSTMPFHSTSNRASWASSASSTSNPNHMGYAYPTVETILDLGEGPSSMDGQHDVYMWAEPMRRRGAMFYGYDGQPESANGSSVLGDREASGIGSADTVRVGVDATTTDARGTGGGILFPRQAIPVCMSSPNINLNHYADPTPATANATRMSFAPSYFSAATSIGTSEKRKRNKLRKLPPEMKARLAAARDNEGLWMKTKGKGKEREKMRRNSGTMVDVAVARQRGSGREKWRVPSYIVDGRDFEQMGLEGHRPDPYREVLVDRRSWIEFGAEGGRMNGGREVTVVPRAAVLSRQRAELEQEKARSMGQVQVQHQDANLTGVERGDDESWRPPDLVLDTNIPKERGRRMSVTFDEVSLVHTHGPGGMPLPGGPRRLSDDGTVLAGTDSGTHTPPRLSRTITSRSVPSSSASRSGSSSASASASATSTAPTSPGASEEGRLASPWFSPGARGYFAGREKEDNPRMSLADSERADMRISTSRVSLARSISGPGAVQRPRKLVKKRPGSVVSVVAPSSVPPSADIGDTVKKAAVTVEEKEAGDIDSGTEKEGQQQQHPTRTRSILGIRLNPKKDKRKSLAVLDESESGGEPGEVRMLPPMRPSSPLWAGCSGTLLSPYHGHSTARSQSRPQSQSSPESPPQASSTTNALTSLAFTGNTTLSSSALAALTSRLSQHEQDANPAKDWHSVGREAFDPYAEHGTSQREGSKGKHKSKDSQKDQEDDQPTQQNLGASLARKAKEITRRSSMSLMRIEAHMHASHASSDLMASGSTHPKSKSMPVSGVSTPVAVNGSFSVPRSSSSAISPSSADASGPSTPARPPMPRRRSKTISEGHFHPQNLRRWTLAMADVPDEVLVQELERMRLEGRGRRRRAASSQGHGTSEATPERKGGADGKAFVYGGPGTSSLEAGASHSGTGSSGSHGRRAYEDDARSVYSDDRSLDMHSPKHGEEDEGFVDAEESPDPEDDAEWKTARRALLCCRELVRTERNYQARLRQLLEGDTVGTASSFVLSYVPALLNASEALLARLEDDPSAWGVSVAFVAVEEELEAAFLAWCGIVGDIFIRDDDGEDREKEKEKTSRRVSMSFKNLDDGGTWGLRKRSRSGVSVTRLESVYRRRDEPDSSEHTSPAPLGMFTAALGTGLAYGISPPTSSTGHAEQPEVKQGRNRTMAQASSSGPLLSRRFSTWRRMSMFSSSTSLLQSPSSPSSSHAHASPVKEKKSSVRELAIQPTQRIMRYVLQYRDLLQNTPMESPSRGLVERALESATRIADKCDRAQGNSAFFLRT